MERQSVLFRDLGEMDYRAAWNYQENLLQQNIKAKARSSNFQLPDVAANEDDAETTNYLLFVEHPPVYTLGKSGNISNILIDPDECEARGIQFVHTNRGGDVTFHGSGQVVGYPILDLEKFYKDIGKYLRQLEEVVILTLAEYDIHGERSPGETGVWLDTAVKGRERKICAMGVRCSRWVTMHGFALNVNTDLSYFEYIIPCGIKNKSVTSMKQELGQDVNTEEVKAKLRTNFEKVFQVTVHEDQKPLAR